MKTIGGSPSLLLEIVFEDFVYFGVGFYPYLIWLDLEEAAY